MIERRIEHGTLVFVKKYLSKGLLEGAYEKTVGGNVFVEKLITQICEILDNPEKII